VEYDIEKIDRAVLALLYLNLETTGTAWKGFDWDSMGRLHEKGLISDPVSKAKSVRLNEDGIAAAEQAFEELFGK
jgi:hypothetical protein